MAIIEIPLDSTLTYYDEIIQLESLEYLFEFAWSDRDSAFYLNLYDQDGNPLAIGIKLLLNVDLLRRFPVATMPPGKLICVDAGSAGNGVDIAQPSDLGTRVFLEYITSDDTSLTG